MTLEAVIKELVSLNVEMPKPIAIRYHTYTRMKLLSLFFLFSSTYGWSQDAVVLSLPDSNPLYSGYDNVVQISNRKIKNVYLECDYCDTIRQHPTIKSQWVIKPGDSTNITLTVRKKNGKVIGEQTFKVFSPPQPTMYLDTLNAQGTVTSFPNSLSAKYETNVPLQTVFMTRNWEIQIDDMTFIGSGSGITDEVKNYLKIKKQGVLIVSATFLGPFGSFELKDIFEFAIE